MNELLTRPLQRRAGLRFSCFVAQWPAAADDVGFGMTIGKRRLLDSFAGSSGKFAAGWAGARSYQ
jgi:hypothetical protein